MPSRSVFVALTLGKTKTSFFRTLPISTKAFSTSLAPKPNRLHPKAENEAIVKALNKKFFISTFLSLRHGNEIIEFLPQRTPMWEADIHELLEESTVVLHFQVRQLMHDDVVDAVKRNSCKF